MKHGSFTHAVTGASVDVVETLGGPETGKIECTCASFGLGADLVYRLEERPAGWTLVVKEMKTEPSIPGLGSLLMWHAAHTALLGGAALMDAAAVARDAPDCCRESGFLPDAEETGARARVVTGRCVDDLPRDGEAQPDAAEAAAWHAQTMRVLDRSYARISRVWTRP